MHKKTIFLLFLFGLFPLIGFAKSHKEEDVFKTHHWKPITLNKIQIPQKSCPALSSWLASPSYKSQPLSWLSAGGNAQHNSLPFFTEQNIITSSHLVVDHRFKSSKSFRSPLIPPLPILSQAGILYTISQDGMILGLDPSNFHKVFSLSFKQHFPLSSNNDIYSLFLVASQSTVVGIFGSKILAFDENTHKVLWSIDKKTIIPYPPLAYKDTLLIQNQSNNFEAINLHTGETLWVRDGQQSSDFLTPSIPAAIGETFILKTDARQITFADMKKGDTLAIAETNPPYHSSSLDDSQDASIHFLHYPVLQNNTIFFSQPNGPSTLFDLYSLKIIWRETLSLSTMPLLLDHYLFSIRGEDTLSAQQIIPSPSMCWSVTLPVSKQYEKKSFHIPFTKHKKRFISWNSPTLFGRNLILTNSYGELFVINATNGSILQTLDLHQPIVHTPITSENTLYITLASGEILSIRQSA